MKRDSVLSINEAALAWPRWTAIRMSVSKSTEAPSPQFLHFPGDAGLFSGKAAEERVFSRSRFRGGVGGCDGSLHFAPVKDGDLLFPIQARRTSFIL
jgi:hypothetical protein